MVLLILAVLTVVAVGALVFRRREHKERRIGDLGTVSQGWIANHRASSFEANR